MLKFRHVCTYVRTTYVKITGRDSWSAKWINRILGHYSNFLPVLDKSLQKRNKTKSPTNFQLVGVILEQTLSSCSFAACFQILKSCFNARLIKIQNKPQLT